MEQVKHNPQTLSTAQLTHGAWQFAYAILWQEEHFSVKEIQRVQQQIAVYFSGHTDQQTAFTLFCERIIIANRLLAAETSRYLPHPSIWFNTSFQQGFSGTAQPHQQWGLARQSDPCCQQGISALADYYWQYTYKPSNKIFAACRKKLLQLKEYGLLQLFYYSVIYSRLLNPKH